jgi:hypothetical protein
MSEQPRQFRGHPEALAAARAWPPTPPSELLRYARAVLRVQHAPGGERLGCWATHPTLGPLSDAERLALLAAVASSRSDGERLAAVLDGDALGDAAGLASPSDRAALLHALEERGLVEAYRPAGKGRGATVLLLHRIEATARPAGVSASATRRPSRAAVAGLRASTADERLPQRDYAAERAERRLEHARLESAIGELVAECPRELQEDARVVALEWARARVRAGHHVSAELVGTAVVGPLRELLDYGADRMVVGEVLRRPHCIEVAQQLDGRWSAWFEAAVRGAERDLAEELGELSTDELAWWVG